MNPQNHLKTERPILSKRHQAVKVWKQKNPLMKVILLNHRLLVKRLRKQVKVQVRLKVRHLPQVAVRRQRIQLRILQRLVCLLLPKGHQEPVIHQSQMIRQQIPPKVLRNQRHPTQVLQSANCRHPISL